MSRTSLFAAAVALAAASVPAQAGPIGYSVRSDEDVSLYRINLGTGAATLIGPVEPFGITDVDGLAFQPGTNVLFGVDDVFDFLITIDLATGLGLGVGDLGVDVLDTGLTFDAAGNLYLADEGTQGFYSVDPTTGAATLIGSTGREITALGAVGSTVYGIDDENNQLVTIDPATGATTLVGDLGVDVGDTGLDAFGGLLYAVEDDGRIFTIDPATGAATEVGSTLDGFEGLAIGPQAAVPEPATLALAGAGLAGLAGYRLRRR